MLRGSGFIIDALHELYTPTDAPDHPYYALAIAEWARQWPVEEIWAAHLADLPNGTGRCQSSDTRSPTMRWSSNGARIIGLRPDPLVMGGLVPG